LKDSITELDCQGSYRESRLTPNSLVRATIKAARHTVPFALIFYPAVEIIAHDVAVQVWCS
jgi:hypothetical protein